MPHKWCKEICAWAQGQKVLYRVQRSNNTWSEWYSLNPEVARFDSSLTMELRIADEPLPHKWQVQKEAYLAGLPVEFRGIGDDNWRQVDSWLISYAEKGDPSCPLALWDRPWLEFRLMQGDQHSLYVSAAPKVLQFTEKDANLKLTFVGNSLRASEVIRH